MRAWRSLSCHHETCYISLWCTVARPHTRACSTLPRSEIAAAREERAQTEAWAKQPGAREVLAQPPFVVAGEGEGASPPAADMLDSLDSYLKVRFLIHLVDVRMAEVAGFQVLLSSSRRLTFFFEFLNV